MLLQHAPSACCCCFSSYMVRLMVQPEYQNEVDFVNHATERLSRSKELTRGFLFHYGLKHNCVFCRKFRKKVIKSTRLLFLISALSVLCLGLCRRFSRPILCICREDDDTMTQTSFLIEQACDPFECVSGRAYRLCGSIWSNEVMSHASHLNSCLYKMPPVTESLALTRTYAIIVLQLVNVHTLS